MQNLDWLEKYVVSLYGDLVESGRFFGPCIEKSGYATSIAYLGDQYGILIEIDYREFSVASLIVNSKSRQLLPRGKQAPKSLDTIIHEQKWTDIPLNTAESKRQGIHGVMEYLNEDKKRNVMAMPSLDALGEAIWVR